MMRVSLLALSLVVGGCALAPTGDFPVRVRVNGADYTVGVVRDLEVRPSDLAAGPPIEYAANEDQFAELTTYQLAGVDPRAFLLAPAKPGLRDDAGPWGAYLALWGPGQAFPAVCAYFPADSPTRAEEC